MGLSEDVRWNFRSANSPGSTLTLSGAVPAKWSLGQSTNVPRGRLYGMSSCIEWAGLELQVHSNDQPANDCFCGGISGISTRACSLLRFFNLVPQIRSKVAAHALRGSNSRGS
jgi:hypothetical protein